MNKKSVVACRICGLVDVRFANLTQQGEDFRLVLANNSTTTNPINSLPISTSVPCITQRGGKKRWGKTYNRPNKSPLILLKPFQSVLGITRSLDNLPRHVRLALNSLVPLCTRRDIVEDTTQLVCRGRGLGDLELELGALVLGVV